MARDPMISLLPGYTVTEEVYRSRRRVVYRATRDRDGAKVVLKTLVKGSGGLGPSAANSSSFGASILKVFRGPSSW